jgi:hypothetical protein
MLVTDRVAGHRRCAELFHVTWDFVDTSEEAVRRNLAFFSVESQRLCELAAALRFASSL